MAFKLDKAQRKTFDELCDRLNRTGEELEAAVTAYNETLEKLRDFRDERVAQWEEELDGKSETWRDGERGQAAEELKGEWEGLNLEDVEIELTHEGELNGLRTDTQS